MLTLILIWLSGSILAYFTGRWSKRLEYDYTKEIRAINIFMSLILSYLWFILTLIKGISIKYHDKMNEDAKW